MKKTALFFFLLLLSGTGIAQQNKVDSLSLQIASLPVDDPATIDLRNEYLKQALYANPADTTLLDFANKTLETARNLDYTKGMVVANERLGLIYQYTFSNPYLAVDHYQKALAIIGRDKSLESGKWGILGNIGTIYYEQEEYRKALTYFREVLANDKEMELPATANIGNIYGSLHQPDSAIYYYRKAVLLTQQQNNVAYQANLLSNLALVYERSGNVPEATRSIEDGLSLINKYDIGFVRPTAYMNAAMVYLAGKEYVKAGKFARDALKQDKSLGNLFMQKSAWGTLADVYTAQKRYKEALEAHIRYADLQDSLNNQNRRVEISRKQMQFDFDKKEALIMAENENEKSLAQAEIKRQVTIKKTAVIGGAGLLLASVFGFVLYKRRRDAFAQKQEAEFKALVAETELKALRSQMNPHFIFNSLNSIGDYILKNDTAAARSYLTTFAKLMRQTLENSDHKEITLEEDLNFIRLYLLAETKRLQGKFSYDIHVDKTIDQQNTLVPPMLLQPFIENSIWHGISKKKGQGHIIVEIKYETGMLICSVDDDGIGRRATETDESKKQSLGIAITENRLAILNKQHRTNSRLSIIDKENNQGTRVEIHLPLQFAF